MKKVLLVSMPWGALGRQALGISLLKAKLATVDISCDVRYLTFAFADLIGYEEYQWMSAALPYSAFAGDWSFTSALYGERPELDKKYLDEVLGTAWQLRDADIDRILRIRSFVPRFLDNSIDAIPWQDYALVGFTSTFEQNIASLSLAKRIKALYPEIAIVFGGANWEEEMGCELLRQFAFVDYACSGEAENTFPALVQTILAGATIREEGEQIPGVIFRAGERVILTRGEPVRRLDDLPYPDYSDYFRDLAYSTTSGTVVPLLLFESSRGCWWGAKSHCTFCGLNGGSMGFRSKTPHRVLEELDYLAGKWRINMIEAVDNILDMKYFNNVLLALARAGRPLRLFYEVKANLSRKHVKLLHDAGVRRIQPGIESMSDHVLKLMRKGTTALQNVQLLKWCKEYGVWVDWNILYGFPGETSEDYAAMLRLLRSIRFLQPPGACGSIHLDRFSPYFEDPAPFGIVNVRPLKPYQYLYPFDAQSLCKVAYYFDYDYEPGVHPNEYAAEVISYVRDWKSRPEKGTLSSIICSDGTLVLRDTRSDAVHHELVLTGAERAVYEYCDELQSVSSVMEYLREQFPQLTINEGRVRGFLESLIANHLMIGDGSHYLSLAIRRKAAHLSPWETPERFSASTVGTAQQPLSSYLPQS